MLHNVLELFEKIILFISLSYKIHVLISNFCKIASRTSIKSEGIFALYSCEVVQHNDRLNLGWFLSITECFYELNFTLLNWITNNSFDLWLWGIRTFCRFRDWETFQNPDKWNLIVFGKHAPEMFQFFAAKGIDKSLFTLIDFAVIIKDNVKISIIGFFYLSSW